MNSNLEDITQEKLIQELILKKNLAENKTSLVAGFLLKEIEDAKRKMAKYKNKTTEFALEEKLLKVLEQIKKEFELLK